MWKLWEKILEMTHKEGSPLGLPPNKALMAATDTFLRKPAIVTKRSPHIRDASDLKRFMFTVVVALLPCYAFGIYNTGRNAYLAIGVKDATLVQCLVEGAAWVLPLLVITYAIGGAWEGLFAQLRGHEVSEGFLVTGALLPLIIPATLPWWQLALAVSFGVVIGKEVFGGVGMNILNPALTGRAFLFFAYPAQISGDVWVPTPVVKNAAGALEPYWQTTLQLFAPEKLQAFIDGSAKAVDGYSGATALAVVATNEAGKDSLESMHSLYSVADMFWGFIPGSIGETSVVAILMGAFVLILTGVGSWRTMVGVFVGGFVVASIFALASQGSSDVPDFFKLAAHEHLIMGGFAFGAVFMATDPVSSPLQQTSKLIYGFLIGGLCIVIRTVNPAYPEGMMLAILFMNVFAPLIDHYVVEAKLKRRAAHAN
jgi:Na+-transporting NADH:ubiquinone oxidoreductase subunit B